MRFISITERLEISTSYSRAGLKNSLCLLQKYTLRGMHQVLFDKSYSFFLPLSKGRAYTCRQAFAIWVRSSPSKQERDETAAVYREQPLVCFAA